MCDRFFFCLAPFPSFFRLFHVETSSHTATHVRIIQQQTQSFIAIRTALSDKVNASFRKEGNKLFVTDTLTETFVQFLRVLQTSTAGYRVIQKALINLISSCIPCVTSWYSQRMRRRERGLAQLCSSHAHG
jgi:hypothetical protein